ncbi:hypothetical protein [Aminipila luticellarii]|uniref:hypothetical protein n=1 Tax=Aminipila luticellarii TaxID=2507160 RepID=UPI0013E89BA9|nr:hypothetical protein [Aminipila luticellarii]
MNKYGNKTGIRYSRANSTLHIVFGKFHIKANLRALVIENARTGNAAWLYGWSE